MKLQMAAENPGADNLSHQMWTVAPFSSWSFSPPIQTAPMANMCWCLLRFKHSKYFTQLTNLPLTINPTGFPGGSAVKNLLAKAGDVGSIARIGKIPRRRKWQLTPVFLPGKSHGQRSLAGSSPWGHKRIRHDSATKQQQINPTMWVWLLPYFPDEDTQA